MPLSLLYPAGNKLYDATNTFFGLNPGSTVCAARKLRMKSPEQTSSSNDSAICATTSALESRAFLTLPVLAPESSFSTAIGERSLARMAGSTPNITPASSEIKNVTNSTVPFAEIFSTIGMPDGGMNRENDPAVQAVISIASPPASTASSVLSTKNCRTTRQRVAPTESRIAISRLRLREPGLQAARQNQPIRPAIRQPVVTGNPLALHRHRHPHFHLHAGLAAL